MCRLEGLYIWVVWHNYRFKYNSCVGWSGWSGFRVIEEKSLNTTHVSVGVSSRGLTANRRAV